VVRAAAVVQCTVSVDTRNRMELTLYCIALGWTAVTCVYSGGVYVCDLSCPIRVVDIPIMCPQMTCCAYVGVNIECSILLS
jgi:hypothetical protein